MPRVLFLTDSLNNGGAERQLILLARNMPFMWESFIWSLNGGPFAKHLNDAQIQHRVALRKFRFDISPLFDLFWLIRSYKPDLIHSWGWVTTLMAAPIAKIFRIPLVNGIVRSGEPFYDRRSMFKISSHFGDIVVSNSQAGLLHWRIKPARGVVIYNGFDRHRILNDAKPNHYQTNDKFIVVMAARMIKGKDFSLFIAVLRKLVDAGETNWKFLAIGQGEYKDTLIKESDNLIQEEFLEFPDAGLDVIPFLQRSNVGVLLTRPIYHEEGCSNTIMEYMACNLPVVCSDSGGNRELVVDKETGFIIEPNNPDALVEKLIWLKQHPDAARNMGLAGRERTLREFTTTNMVERTLSVYQEVLRK